MEHRARVWQLVKTALDNYPAKDVFVDAHGHVDLLQGLRADRKVQLPYLRLRSGTQAIKQVMMR
jgi:hypothetical protein